MDSEEQEVQLACISKALDDLSVTRLIIIITIAPTYIHIGTAICMYKYWSGKGAHQLRRMMTSFIFKGIGKAIREIGY